MVIAAVSPQLDGGRYAVKRTIGDRLRATADLLVDGHDRVGARLRHRCEADAAWTITPMRALGPHAPDRFVAEAPLERLGVVLYEVDAWVDELASWRHGLERKVGAGQDVSVELLVGAGLLAAAAARARDAGAVDEGAALADAARALGDTTLPAAQRASLGLSAGLAERAAAHPDLSRSTSLTAPRRVLVERERARFSAWYEFFPRSCGPDGRHGTLRDAAAMLDAAASMGFDVVYLPPVHPIGRTHRKGRDNSLVAGPDDPGSPWAIGAAEGGHEALHPALGTLDDFAAFIERAASLGIDVAIDVAFQASPDHPWVGEHPDWFVRRPDGTIQYAENPPKKYQDVYPFDFQCADWRGLWDALRDVFLIWAARGVRVFRVDNPHTKPIPFWEWCLAEVRARYPDAIFLSEAFTRPLLLHELARVGFSQSYTYFTWRTTRPELEQYLGELTQPEVLDYLRPNFWPNTPDILPEHLQTGGRAAFAQRVILAATLAANYGIYGPAYELCDARAIEGREEYAASEKYQLRAWDTDAPHSLRHLIARLNRARREHPALQRDGGLRFHPTDDDALLCYSRTLGGGADEAERDVILCVVNLDPYHRRAGFVTLDLPALGLPRDASFQVHDLIGDARFQWQGPRNYVELDPHAMPAHVFVVRRHVHREQGFDYYL